MSVPPFLHGYSSLFAQIGIAGLVVMGIELAPPKQGQMIVLSLHGEDMASIAGWVADNRTSILGSGPVAGSLTIDGDRATLAPRARAHGALLLAGPAILCGQKESNQ
jgi:hypothetical protein